MSTPKYTQQEVDKLLEKERAKERERIRKILEKDLESEPNLEVGTGIARAICLLKDSEGGKEKDTNQ